MNEQTFNRRFNQLVTLINIHPNRDELLRIIEEQVTDDTEIIADAGKKKSIILRKDDMQDTKI